MRFAFWEPGMARRDDVVAVDAAVPAAVQLSNRPGNATPDAHRADLVVEMALSLVDDPDATADLEIVAADRYATDPVLAAWVLSEPDAAARHRDLLVDAAASGAFLEYPGDAAVRLDLLVDRYRHGDESPLAFKVADWGARKADEVIFEVVLASLPSLLDQVDEYQYVWRDAWRTIQDDRDAFRNGAFATVRDGPVTRIEASRPPSPRAISEACPGPFHLLAVEAPGGHRYRLDAAYHAWAETVDRPWIDVPDISDLLADLDQDEPADRGRWLGDGYRGKGPTEILRYAEPDGTMPASGLEPEDVHARIAAALEERSASQ